MKHVICLFLVLLFSSVCSRQVLAKEHNEKAIKTVYVNGTSGNDSSAGTYTDPVRTLYQAYRRLQNTGGVISVQRPVYLSGETQIKDNLYSGKEGSVPIRGGNRVQLVRYSTNPYKLISHTDSSSLTIVNMEFNGYGYDSGEASGFITKKNGSLNVSGATFRNLSNAQSAGWSAALEIRNCKATIRDTVFQNLYSQGGSAIHADDNSQVTVRNTSFTNCSGNKNNESGAIFCSNASMTISESTFQKNHATFGSSICIWGDKPVSIDSSTFQDNETTNHSGAISSLGNAKLTITNSTFQRNKALGSNGGAIFTTSPLVIESCSFRNNYAKDRGSVIYNAKTATISDSTFEENEVVMTGGAIYNQGNLTMTNSHFKRNSAHNDAPAIFNQGIVDLTGCEFVDNVGSDLGGAIYSSQLANQARVKMTIRNSTFRGNRFQTRPANESENRKSGGAINTDCDLLLDHVIFENNQANSGGAIVSNSASVIPLPPSLAVHTVTLRNCELRNNQALTDNGGAIISGSHLQIENSVLESNRAASVGGAISLSLKDGSGNGSSVSIKGTRFMKNHSEERGGALDVTYHSNSFETTLYHNVMVADCTFTENTSSKGGAVFTHVPISLKGSTEFQVSETMNDIYLQNDYPSAFLYVSDKLSAKMVGRITPFVYTNGCMVVRNEITKQAKGSDIVTQFALTPQERHVLRPADYLDASAVAKKKDSDVIISESFDLVYQGDSDTIKIPSPMVIYWNETDQIASEVPEKRGHVFQAWSTRRNGTGVNYYPAQSFSSTSSLTLYAIWEPITYTIRFHPNADHGTGDVTGNMSSITLKYGEAIPLPKNQYRKTTQLPPEYEGGSAIEKTSVFLGWNTIADALTASYEDEAVIENLTTMEHAVINLYAIWDDAPSFQIVSYPDRYFTIEEAQDGAITEEELLNTVVVYDRETNPLPKKTSADVALSDDTGVTIVDYDADEFKSITKDTVVSIRYKVKDAQGTEAFLTIFVYVTQNGTKAEPVVTYLRSLGEAYQDAPAAYGGLQENSRWKLDTAYKQTLDKAFQKHTPSYRLDKSELEQIRMYVNEHGFGNSIERYGLSDVQTIYKEN